MVNNLSIALHDPVLHCLGQSSSFGAWLYDDHLVTCDLQKKHIELHNPASAAIWLLLSDVTNDVTNDANSDANIVKEYADLFALPLAQARSDVDACLANWLKYGWVVCDVSNTWRLCLPDEQVSPDSKAFSRIADESFCDNVIHRGFYCFGDVAFELQIRSSATKVAIDPLKQGFTERLIAICEGFAKLDKLPSRAGWVTVSIEDEHIVLMDSGDQQARRLEAGLEMGLVYEAMIGVSYPARDVVLALHAAGVKQGRCLALAGVSGVGKSTLSALLAKAGWELLGDDILAIELNEGGQSTPSLGLLRFPTAISLKSGSWPRLLPLYSELTDLSVLPYAYGGKEAKYLPVAHTATPQTVSSWDAIILPRFVADQALKVQALRPALGLQGLLTAGLSMFGAPTIQTIHHALNALIRLPCFDIEYADFEEVNACLKDLQIN
jgi:hypothetical protein